MKNKAIKILAVLMLGVAVPASAMANHTADHSSHGTEAETSTTVENPSQAAGSHDVSVEVNGLVCDFCAQAINKVFRKHEEVSNVHVDLDTHLITIDFIEGKSMDDSTITSLITDAGYNVVNIHRQP